MHFWKRIACLAIGWMLMSGALAGETKYYKIAFELTQVDRAPGVDCARFESFTFPGNGMVYYTPHWGCLNAGEKYQGSFGIDSDALVNDGVGYVFGLKDFKLTFGRLVLDKEQNDGIHWAARFAGRCPGIYGCIAYEAKDGELVSLIGGVFLGADVAYIDFWGPIPDKFSGGSYGQSFRGNMSITPVPEPAAVLLMLLGIAAVAAAVQARAKASRC